LKKEKGKGSAELQNISQSVKMEQKENMNRKMLIKLMEKEQNEKRDLQCKVHYCSLFDL
jgi:hypothetical protein